MSILPTLIYILSSFYFISYVNLGAGSFFLANTISMLIRIIIAWNLEIKKHIQLEEFLEKIRPSWLFIVSLIVTFLLGKEGLGVRRFDSHFLNMIIGGLLFIINVIVILWENMSVVKVQVVKVLDRIKNNIKRKKQ
jgi:hypothetical protein